MLLSIEEMEWELSFRKINSRTGNSLELGGNYQRVSTAIA